MPSATHSCALIALALVIVAAGCRQRDETADAPPDESATTGQADSAHAESPGEPDAEAGAAKPQRPVHIIPGPPPGEFATLTRQASLAVVNIRTKGEVTGGPASMYPNARPHPSLGSGFLIDRDRGYVLTNLHVVANASSLRVVFHNGEERAAELIGPDHNLDVALLQLGGRQLPEDIQGLTLGESENLSVGQWILALGNPFGGEVTASAGIVSSKGGVTSVYEPPSQQFRSLLHTDAAIHRGNTGGPMLDLAGQVVGINLAAPELGGRSNGIGFAVPSSAVRRVFKQLEKGAVTESWLGIFVHPASADELAGCAARGVRITQVVRAGPAARAQLRVGDIITGFDGHEVDTRKLAALTRSSTPGETVELTICRNGGTLKRPLTVEEKPS